MKKANKKIKGLLPVPYNFREWNKPKLWCTKPEKVLVDVSEVVQTFRLNNYSDIPVREGYKYRIGDIETDYNGCYYESDSPDLIVVVEEYITTTKENPDYDAQLKKYNSAKEKYKKELAEFNKNLKNYQHNQKLIAEYEEKAEYERLKAKFEAD